MDMEFDSPYVRHLLTEEEEGEATVNMVFTVAYVLVAACLVAPPTEFISAGLTVQNVFSHFLGSEQLNFVYYHIRRTTATVVFHSILPLGYYMIAGWVNPELRLFTPWRANFYWRLFCCVCLSLPVGAGILAFYWSRKNWAHHPIAKTLAHYASVGSSWAAVASSINVEFRRIDKFTTGSPGRRIIVTDSWVMKTMAYSVNVAHQSDVHLNLVGSEEHAVSHESTTGVQYLNIAVNCVHENVPSFVIRLNAMEYGDLREKLQRPVRNARNVVIQQSLSDRFLEAFREQVQQNRPYRTSADMELEPCIGCMQKQANVKLQKLCDNPNEGDCQNCFCRPMWCLECMGKWFASRQDQQQPENWMECKSPCPTCRATFCMLDICKLL